MPGHQVLDMQKKINHAVSDTGAGRVIRHLFQDQDWQLVTLTTEVGTVPNPEKAGLEMTISMKTYGGSCTLTFATAYDEVGSTTMVFASAGAFVRLQSVAISTTALAWRVIGYDGVTGPSISLGTISPTGVIRTSYTTQIGSRAKVGGTSGWTVGAANDLGTIATMAASQAAGTLVIPIDGLHIGDTITGFTINAQVESAGNAVTIDADLRALTNVAADPTDASIGAITQVSVIADTAVAASKTGLTEVVTAGKTYYLLITATTLGSTDIQLLAPTITVTTS